MATKRTMHGRNDVKDMVVGSLWISTSHRAGTTGSATRVIRIEEVKRGLNPMSGKDDVCILVGAAPGHKGTRRWMWFERTARYRARFCPYQAEPPASAPARLADESDAEAARRLIKTAREALAALDEIVGRLR